MKIPIWIICIVSVSVSLILGACEKKPPQVPEKPTAASENFETTRLGEAVDAYLDAPTDENSGTVDRAVAELNGEIAELNQRVSEVSGDELEEAKRKAENLRSYRDKGVLRFQAAKAKAKANGSEDEE